MKLQWVVELEGQPPYTGTADAPGVGRIRCDAPEGILKSVTARMEFPLAPAEKAFFNGYQSWTWCPEVGPRARQRGVKHIPGPLLKIFDASETLLSVGIPALRIISLSFCMAGACIALGSSFQALGKSVYSMITSIVRQLVFLIPIAYVLARYGASVGNSDLVWWSYPIAEVFSLTLTLCFFRHVYKTTIAPLPEGRE